MSQEIRSSPGLSLAKVRPVMAPRLSCWAKTGAPGVLEMNRTRATARLVRARSTDFYGWGLMSLPGLANMLHSLSRR